MDVVAVEDVHGEPLGRVLDDPLTGRTMEVRALGEHLVVCVQHAALLYAKQSIKWRRSVGVLHLRIC